MKKIQKMTLVGYFRKVENYSFDFLIPAFKKEKSFYIQNIDMSNDEANFIEISKNLESKIIESDKLRRLDIKENEAIHLFKNEKDIYYGNRVSISSLMIDVYNEHEDIIDPFMKHEIFCFCGFSALTEKVRQNIKIEQNINIHKSIIEYTSQGNKNKLVESILQNLIHNIDKIKDPYETVLENIIYTENDSIELGSLKINKKEFFDHYIDNEESINNLTTIDGILLFIYFSKKLNSSDSEHFFSKLNNHELLNSNSSRNSSDLSLYLDLLKWKNLKANKYEAEVMHKLVGLKSKSEQGSPVVLLKDFEMSEFEGIQKKDYDKIAPKELLDLDNTKELVQKVYV